MMKNTPPVKEVAPVQPKQRLMSLDILRGADLFFLVALQPLLWKLCDAHQSPFTIALREQINHVVWEGFSVWDIVMPLFLFMSGITIPFAFSQYKKGAKKDAALWLKILRRFVILWVLGCFVQGNLLAFDSSQFRIFSNTLQSIAVGYLVASLLFLFFKTKWQIVFAFFFLMTYWAVFYFVGNNDFSPMGNIACLIDNAVLGRFKDGVYWDNGQWFFADWYTNTWILSSLNFSVTMLLGTFSGTLLKSAISENRKALYLGGLGVVLIAIGLVWDLQMPIIKRLWTSSMTLFSGGICCLLMAIFYYVIDVRKIQKPFLWLRIYGMNSIVAYVLFEAMNFRCIGRSLFHGLEQFSANFYPLFLEVSQVGFVFLVLYFMYKHKYFVKI